MTACFLLPFFIFSWSSSPERQRSSEWSGCSSSRDPPRTRWQRSPASCYWTQSTQGIRSEAHAILDIRILRVPAQTYWMKLAWLLCLVLLSLSFSCSSCRLYLRTLLSLSSSLSRAKPIISFLLFSSSSAERRLRGGIYSDWIKPSAVVMIRGSNRKTLTLNLKGLIHLEYPEGWRSFVTFKGALGGF